MEYFEACARIRDITRARLFDRLLRAIAADHLVQSVLDDGSRPCRVKGEHRWRDRT